MYSTRTGVGQNSMPESPRVRWQWFEGKDGGEWKDYGAAENVQIEGAFQKGLTHARVHSGKESSMKGNLKELFFGDMIQYNPVSGKARDIRRLGPDNIFRKTLRLILGYLDSVENGKNRYKTFLKYKKHLKANSYLGFSSESKSFVGGQELLEAENEKHKPARSEFCARIVKSGAFIVAQMVAILLNTIVIGFDVEYNTVEATDSTRTCFKVIDNAFCIFFTVEVMLRFGAMKRRKTIRRAVEKLFADHWFVFDTVLVLFMVIETWIIALFLDDRKDLDQLATFRLLRLIRLSRVGRVARLLRFFPEIVNMMKSILAAMRAVICTLVMLLIMVYIFAIIFKSRSEQTTIQDKFPSLGHSMWTLLVHGALMDSLALTVEPIAEEDMSLAILFMLFVFLSNLTVLNMLIGVICEVANQVSVREHETASAKSLKSDLDEFLECFDMDEDQTISKQEFDMLLGNPDVKCALERHEVDVIALEGLKESLFIDKDAMAKAKLEAATDINELKTIDGVGHPDTIWKTLTFDELIDTILRFKGGRGDYASMLDIVNLERNLQHEFLESFKNVSSQIRQIHAAQRFASAAQRSCANLSSTTSTSQRIDTRDGPSEILEKELPDTNFEKEVSKEANGVTDQCHPHAQGMSLAAGMSEDALTPKSSSMPSEFVVHESSATPKYIEITSIMPTSPENVLVTQLKQEIAQQLSDFQAENRKQIECLVAGQHEIVAAHAQFGQLVRDKISLSFQAQNKDADERCPLSAEQSQTAPKDASFAGNKFPRRTDVQVQQVDNRYGIGMLADMYQQMRTLQASNENLIKWFSRLRDRKAERVRGLAIAEVNDAAARSSQEQPAAITAAASSSQQQATSWQQQQSSPLANIPHHQELKESAASSSADIQDSAGSESKAAPKAG